MATLLKCAAYSALALMCLVTAADHLILRLDVGKSEAPTAEALREARRERNNALADRDEAVRAKIRAEQELLVARVELDAVRRCAVFLPAKPAAAGDRIPPQNVPIPTRAVEP